MSARRQQRAAQRAAEQQRAQVVRGVSGAALVVLVAALVWFGYQRFAAAPAAPAAPAAGDLPGPRGGPSVAQDVGTMVGKPAPAFILNDSEGKPYAVAPGEGRPVVLIFHMGIT